MTGTMALTSETHKVMNISTLPPMEQSLVWSIIAVDAQLVMETAFGSIMATAMQHFTGISVWYQLQMAQ